VQSAQPAEVGHTCVSSRHSVERGGHIDRRGGPPCPPGGASSVRFALSVRTDSRECAPLLVRLKALCGPGDKAELVVTVMMPEEGASCHDAV
jgi:hypothetical protein